MRCCVFRNGTEAAKIIISILGFGKIGEFIHTKPIIVNYTYYCALAECDAVVCCAPIHSLAIIHRLLPMCVCECMCLENMHHLNIMNLKTQVSNLALCFVYLLLHEIRIETFQTNRQNFQPEFLVVDRACVCESVCLSFNGLFARAREKDDDFLLVCVSILMDYFWCLSIHKRQPSHWNELQTKQTWIILR